MRDYARRSFSTPPSVGGESQEETLIIEGRAVVFDSPTLIEGRDKFGNPRRFYEVIDPKAFASCDMNDVPLRSEHDTKVIYARTRNRSLTLNIRSDGLYYTAALLDTSSSRELYTQVKEGLLDRCSFAFPLDSVTKDESPIDGIPTRRVMEIRKLLDISVVAFPAYTDTFVSARADEFDWLAEQEQRLALEKAKVRLFYEKRNFYHD